MNSCCTNIEGLFAIASDKMLSLATKKIDRLILSETVWKCIDFHIISYNIR